MCWTCINTVLGKREEVQSSSYGQEIRQGLVALETELPK